MNRGSESVRIGRVVANSGRDILVLMDGAMGNRPAIRPSDNVMVHTDTEITVGVVTGINAPAPGLENTGDELWIVQVELVGALSSKGGEFTRGVSHPPSLGSVVHLATDDDLRTLYGGPDKTGLPIGHMPGRSSVNATVDASRLVDGGFAVLGSSDSGKSSTLACIARALVRARFPSNILLIDPYNEFSRSFSKAATIIQPTAGQFPHWLLTGEEMAWVLSLNGGSLDRDERSLLDEAIPFARRNFLRRAGQESAAAAVDGPIPYRVTDLISHVDKAGTADNGRTLASCKRLRERIMSAIADPRLSVLFGTAATADSLGNLMTDLFRLEGPPPMAVLQLGRVSEGIDRLIVAIVARLAAALAEWSSTPRRTLLLIDNMERYAPAELQDNVSAFSRKELRVLGGRPRKLGLSLGFTASSPRLVERELLMRSNTMFLHRMPSPLDADAVEEVLPEPAPATVDSLPALGAREAVGVGAGMSFSGRIEMSELPEVAVPGARSKPHDQAEPDDAESIVNRWRHAGAGEGYAASVATG